MEQLFEGVIELKFYEEVLATTPLFSVRKMPGLAPLHDYLFHPMQDVGTFRPTVQISSG